MGQQLSPQRLQVTRDLLLQLLRTMDEAAEHHGKVGVPYSSFTSSPGGSERQERALLCLRR